MATKKTAAAPEPIEPEYVEWSSIVEPDADGWYNHVAVATKDHDITGRLVTDDKDAK